MEMKARVNMTKPKGTTRQQTVFELKNRVVCALNKLADRDTYQIGVEDLDKTVECLSPDGIAPFLYCILDTDSEQKSAVRKECIRLMGTLATFHDVLVGPYLAKMIASVVKRLKDSDSVVRDVCVDTVGVLASKLSSSSRFDTDEVFTVLVRPLFEALGEQNKLVQSGSALCLSRVIDNIHDPPPLVLQKMLARTVKLLKNNHFMAKPAVVELNKSIILAGGATTNSSLTAALTSIQDTLKNADWSTRKAACLALGEIASCGAACLGTFRTSCIRCLESCRFDKVKPVRDIALQALQLWRNLPGPNTPEPSETGSSIKETSCRDYGDVTSTSDSTMKDIKMMKPVTEMANRNISFSSRRPGKTYTEKSHKPGVNDWQIEIAVPTRQNVSVDQIDESEGSSVTKRSENGVRNVKNIGYDYGEMDDKQECSSVSNIFTESIKQSVAGVVSHSDAFDDSCLIKSTGTSQRFVSDEVSIEEQRYLSKKPDRLSLDSTITESTPNSMHGCYSQTEKDLVLVKKQLLEIENKQSNLIDTLKAFTTTIMDSMSMVQLKVSNLELVVDKLGQEIIRGGRYSDVLATKHAKRSPTTVSPRLSDCTPRTSVHSKRQPILPTKKTGIREDNTYSESRSSSFGRQNSDIWTDSNLKPKRSSFGNQIREHENVTGLVPNKSRVNKIGTKNSQWSVMKDHLSDGDLDSAYKEALCSCNELVLFELVGRTGPVLENLSERTASELLSTLALYLLEQRFMSSIIPWLQQFLELSNVHGPDYLFISAKAKRDFLVAIQEAATLDVFSASDRRFFFELGKSLRQKWRNEPDMPLVLCYAVNG